MDWNTLQADFFQNKRTCNRSFDNVELTIKLNDRVCKKNSKSFPHSQYTMNEINTIFTKYTRGFCFLHKLISIYPGYATFIVRKRRSTLKQLLLFFECVKENFHVLSIDVMLFQWLICCVSIQCLRSFTEFSLNHLLTPLFLEKKLSFHVSLHQFDILFISNIYSVILI